MMPSVNYKIFISDSKSTKVKVSVYALSFSYQVAPYLTYNVVIVMDKNITLKNTA